jgi:PAS domain S-box-containing protein
MISTHWQNIYKPSEQEFRLLDLLARQTADLLERKQREEKYLSRLQQEVQERTNELNENKDLVESIADTIPDMISVQEYPSRRMVYHNRDAFARNGFDIDEMQKMTVEERHALIHPDDKKALGKYAKSIEDLSDDDIATLEYRSRHKTKDWVWCRVRTKVLERDETGKVKRIVNIIQNITSQKKAEEELKRNNDLLKSVINASLGTIRVMQSVRDEDGEIIDFVYVMANNGGPEYNVSERKGKLLSEVHPAWIGSDMFRHFKIVVETGNRADFETYYDKEGFNTWFHVVAVKLGDGFVAISEDISERKKAEQLV